MIECSRNFRPIAVAVGALMLLAAPVRAQEASLAPVSPATPLAAEAAPVVAGPTVATASVAVRRAPADAAAAAPAPARGQDRGTALMIVGGAAILTGIVIGNGAGYAISVGGAVVGLYGLYLYLQ
jgi:hypothetical protein